jgi:hypothetical protein
LRTIPTRLLIVNLASKAIRNYLPQRRFGIYLLCGIYYAVSQAERVGRHCSSEPLGIFCGRRPDRCQNTQANRGS